MATWYREKNVLFQLKTLDSSEDFNLWAANFGETVPDSTGQPQKFPMRSGVIIGTDGTPREVQDLKFMKANDFKTLYPKYRKGSKVIRNIIVNGNEYAYSFSMTANKKINDLLGTIKAMNGDPLKAKFQQEFDKSKSPADMYSVKLKEVVQAPSGLNLEGVHIPPKEEVVIDIPAPSFMMSDTERNIIEAMKAAGVDLKDKTRVVQIFTSNGVGATRAESVFNHIK